METVDLLWDEENLEHVARHHVTPTEVEDVCFGRHIIVRGRYGRYILYGTSEAGRYLFVVLERVKGRLFRPVTAREMTSTERARYRQRIRR